MRRRKPATTQAGAFIQLPNIFSQSVAGTETYIQHDNWIQYAGSVDLDG
jgi:hypothetical protein